MAGKAWSIDWEFEKRAVCFNCGADAVQKVELLPVKTTVTCANCGARRLYNIHGTYVASPADTLPVHRHKYDVWHFDREAVCPNHGGAARHAVMVDEFVATIVCPVCNFLHLYEFALFERKKPQE
jgi:DNA-directed RNA polymerase subunit RPC12/RpoP